MSVPLHTLLSIPPLEDASRDPLLVSSHVLEWYGIHRRILPWRASKAQIPNPYHVWLSEMMLQQTTVPTVIPYFHRFIDKWPSFEALATASLDDILHGWQGLGYYSRAKNLYKTAQLIHTQFNNHLPSDVTLLETLPGIGPYTAGAIAAIAFNKSAVPIDGNIIRLLSRLYAVKDPLPSCLPLIKKLATKHTPKNNCGDYVQGLMDLGSLICRPRSPTCPLCPLKNLCIAYQEGNPDAYPKRLEKPPKPTRKLNAYWIENGEGSILLEKRPLKGLLGGMILTPTSCWDNSNTHSPELSCLLKACTLTLQPRPVTHVFTHFTLVVDVYGSSYPLESSNSIGPHSTYFWCPPSSFKHQAFPSLMKKIISSLQKTI